MAELLLIVTGLIVGGVVVAVVMRRIGRGAPVAALQTQTIFERVSAVGRLVGLEVCAKEIATSRKGWGWMPPLLLSQARLAMIFQFEKQYSIDLSRLRPGDVEEVGPATYRVALPPVEGSLRLTDVTPYDIQAGRMLGLLDVIQVDAPTQTDLMRSAQSQAAALYESSDARYLAEARRSVERQLRSLLGLFGAGVEFAWNEPGAPAADTQAAPPPRLRFARAMAAATA
ncbi:MAG: DUF4230 domain-containing protein [Phycisphaerales bacterium]|nr:DUF4230 domain-containing protein [Phycisphaerales bacterium]